MNHSTLVVFTALMCSSIMVRADAASGQEGDLQSHVDRLSFLVGDWICAGKVFAHGSISAHPTSAHAHGTKVVDGHWILFRYDEDKTEENPKPFHIDQYFGYDSDTKQFVSVALDTGGYFSETASEIAGTSISFDEIVGGKIVGHDIFVRSSQDVMSHVGRSQDREGKWVETDEESCHRA